MKTKTATKTLREILLDEIIEYGRILERKERQEMRKQELVIWTLEKH